MKRAIYFFILLSLLAAGACHKIPIGFLSTEYAGYVPDTLWVKSELTDTAHTEEPNPLYDLYLSYGYTPADLASLGIFPTTIVAGEDYFRYKYDVPWVTTQIQGLQGTNPIKITVKRITASGKGNPDEMKRLLEIRGDGTMTLPAKNDILPGSYIISLRFTNEGYSKERDSIFTIVVK